jgi:hypothetical protein
VGGTHPKHRGTFGFPWKCEQRQGIEQPSASTGPNTEQYALMISIASSVISAFAAVMQTWLTHRAIRAGK